MPLDKHHTPTIKTAEVLNGKECAINRWGRGRANSRTYFVCFYCGTVHFDTRRVHSPPNAILF